MNPIYKRRENDLKKIQELEKKYSFLKIVEVKGEPITEIQIKLDLTLPISEKEKQKEFILKILLSANYPMSSPHFSISPPVFHPHVYESGNICRGGKWLVSTPLDQEVERIIKLLLFYPELINTKSVANEKAITWFHKKKAKLPLMRI
ncbi:MAG: hypothetical protein NZ853_07405 [Leptospiraceae bacterium]|nr:hypothetical protein [Leptospiraceae bacterium]MDW7975739.1 ubiquitin-conjugating enzyme E2 [Leptospiraceae bacterium]